MGTLWKGLYSYTSSSNKKQVMQMVGERLLCVLFRLTNGSDTINIK